MKKIKIMSTICFATLLMVGCNTTDKDTTKNDTNYIAKESQKSMGTDDTEVATKTEDGLILSDGKAVMPRTEPMEIKEYNSIVFEDENVQVVLKSTILNDEKFDYKTGTIKMKVTNKKDEPINLQPKELLVDDVVIPQFTFFNEQIAPKQASDIDIVMDGVIVDLPTFKKSIDMVLVASSIDGITFEKEITINHKL